MMKITTTLSLLLWLVACGPRAGQPVPAASKETSNESDAELSLADDALYAVLETPPNFYIHIKDHETSKVGPFYVPRCR